MRRVLDLLGLVSFATIVLGALLVFRPFSRELALHLYLLALGAIVMLGAVAATRAAVPERRRSAFDAALHRRPREDARPPQLERLERAVTLGVAGAFDFHARLRPVLRDAAAARLAVARGVELDSPAGRAALGDEAWELLRPDREPPDDRFAPGISAAGLRALVEDLERL